MTGLIYFILMIMLTKTHGRDSIPPERLVSSMGLNNAYAPSTARITPWNKNGEINIPEFGDITVRCLVTGHPLPKIQWKLAGASLSKRKISTKSNQLTLKEVSRDESGRIICRAYNGIGKPAFATLRVNVYYLDKPKMTIHIPKSVVLSSSIWYENTVNIRCEVKSNPRAEFSWFKDGQKIRPDAAARSGIEIRRLIQYTPPTSAVVMRIRNARESDYGKYDCSSTLGSISSKYSIPDTKESLAYTNSIKPPKIILRSPATVVADPGAAVRLQCDILEGNPVPYVTWKREDYPMPRTGIFSSNRLTLDIIGVRLEDAGTYYCVASNNVNDPVKKKVQVIVRYPLQDDNRLELTNDIRLICNADAQPTDELEYKWYKKNHLGSNIPIDSRALSSNLFVSFTKNQEARKKITFPAYSSTLEIKRMMSHDYGVYVCQATLKRSNNMTVVANIAITRESAPSTIFAVKNQITACEGSKAVLECKTFGRPVAQVIWTREGNSTTPINSDFTTEEGKLVIRNVSRTAAGMYTCYVSRVNGFSKLSKTNSAAHVELIVNYTADVEPKYKEIRQGYGRNLALSCYVSDAEPSWPLQYVWKKDGKVLASFRDSESLILSPFRDENYGLYICDVINYVGSSSCYIKVTGRAYPPEFFYKPLGNKITSSSQMFPEPLGGNGEYFVYLLSWTQKLPLAVDPILKYRIRWRRSTSQSSNLKTTKVLPTSPSWTEETMVKTDITEGGLITYELHNLSVGKYEVEVTPITRFGLGDAAVREITVRKTVGPQPTLKGPSFFCNFDSEELCGFLQERSIPLNTRLKLQNDGSSNDVIKSDTFDWSWNSQDNQLKRTQATGPQFDHTSMVKEGGYLYIEASKTIKNDYAKLVSPMFWDVKSTRQCLKFFYNMNGIHIGRLRVLLRVGNGVERSIWSQSGEQGRSWRSASVSIYSKVPYQIIFEASMTVAGGYLGDIAIDDVLLADGQCTKNTILTTPSGVQKPMRKKGGNSAVQQRNFVSVIIKKLLPNNTQVFLSSTLKMLLLGTFHIFFANYCILSLLINLR